MAKKQESSIEDYSYTPSKEVQNLLDTIEEKVKLDPLSLDEEWLRQPYYCQIYYDALAEVQRDMSIYLFELDKRIRDMILSGTGKPASEARVESGIKKDRKYVEMAYIMNRLEGCVKALEHRKKSLEFESQLCLGQYFSKPKEPNDLSTWNWKKESSIKGSSEHRKRLNRKVH